MSIIYDALKKVETKVKETEQVYPEAVRDTAGKIHEKLHTTQDSGNTIQAAGLAAQEPRQVIFILLAAFLTGSIVFSVMFFQKKENAAAIPKVPPEQAVPFGEDVSGKLSLEGILFDQNVPVAIINGTMVQVNDQIGDFKVTAITARSVEVINVYSRARATLLF